MSNNNFEPGSQHPDQWREDLNPNALAGQNHGVSGAHAENFSRTAADYKDLHQRMNSFDNSELRAIPILPQGARLEQGARYIDLNNLDAGVITAKGVMEAGPENLYVQKSEVEYTLWNRLTGVEDPARLDEADPA